MSDAPQTTADNEALNELLVNCPDFYRLESLLGGFNIFQVLKFEHGEIRHSNVLAWILDPAESHGLDHTFLKKWLMRVIHESGEGHTPPVSAVDVDGLQLIEVEVRREWRSIDVLLLLTLADGRRWVICIENKINSMQHSDQLRRYRTVVEKEFPETARQLFIFLAKNDEKPEDEAYIIASYAQVHQALKECLESRKHAIGQQPRVLLENYLRLLEEKFMDDSEIAQTARRIYQQHKRALDLIFEHRPDSLSMVSERLGKLLADKANQLGILMESSSKSYLRFMPKVWDLPENRYGSAWAGCNRTVLVEISLYGKRPSIYVISGKAPEPWIASIWQRACQPPFHRRSKRVVRPRLWCSLHSEQTPFTMSDDDLEDPTAVALKLFDWCEKWLQSASTKEVIQILAAELPKLGDPMTSSTNPA